MSRLLTRLQRSRLLRGFAHRGTMLLGERFPDHFPMVFVLGFPKSGTTWACQLVADYMRLPFPRFALLPNTFASVVHGHELPNARRTPLAYVVRDGRDVAVSMFHFELAKLRPGDPRPVARQVRRVLPRTRPDPDAALDRFLDFLEIFFDNPPSSPVSWAEHVRTFLNRRTNSQSLLRYERLLTDGPTELSACLAKMTGGEPEPDRVRWALEKFSFDRSRSSNNSPTPQRKGEAGDWRRHFDAESARLFADRAGDLLLELGYEQDASWPERFEPGGSPADARRGAASSQSAGETPAAPQSAEPPTP